MAWTWRCADAAGHPVSPAEPELPVFGAQGDAETWMGENWRALADAGVDQVTLCFDGGVVYGPMSLQPGD